jgi:multiple sugar transport system ATP-binding protein
MLAVEPTGAATHLTMEAAGQTVVAVVRDRVTVGSGANVRIAVDPRIVHLFDPATGMRIGGRL